MSLALRVTVDERVSGCHSQTGCSAHCRSVRGVLPCAPARATSMLCARTPLTVAFFFFLCEAANRDGCFFLECYFFLFDALPEKCVNASWSVVTFNGPSHVIFIVVLYIKFL